MCTYLACFAQPDLVVGADWRYHRRLFQQSFTPKAAARFHPQEREAAQELLQWLLDKPDDLLTHLRQYDLFVFLPSG